MKQMNLFNRKYFALLFLVASNLLSTATADTQFSSGVTLRYSQFTAATEPSSLIGIGYSIKWGSVDYAIEIGAPRGNFDLNGDNTNIGEVNLYTANSIGWQIPVANKFSIRTDLSLANYFVEKFTTGNTITTVTTEIFYALEPRISLMFGITDDIDFSIYGGYAVGSDSFSETTAGAYFRFLWL